MQLFLAGGLGLTDIKVESGKADGYLYLLANNKSDGTIFRIVHRNLKQQ